MKRHKLKIEPQYLERLLSNKKKAEVRYNDRDYQVGDQLEFKGNHLFQITDIHEGLGMADGYVMLSVEYIGSKATWGTV